MACSLAPARSFFFHFHRRERFGRVEPDPFTPWFYVDQGNLSLPFQQGCWLKEKHNLVNSARVRGSLPLFTLGLNPIPLLPEEPSLTYSFILLFTIMPIGVPKVAFRIPGEPSAQWVDLFTRLYRDRVLFLCNELKEELTNQLVGIMLFLNGEEEKKGVYIYINSPGGYLTCGIAVYDCMNFIEAEVTTICVGTAASVASFVLAGGSIGNRIAFPNSRVMIHQPEGGSQGQASEIVFEASEVVRIRREMAKAYAERTGQSVARISRDMDRDQYMSAVEAKDYGLVDQVSIEG